SLDAPDEDLSDQQRSLAGSAPEVAVALADYDCRSAVDYLPRFIEIQTRVEAEFVAQNHGQLDSLLAAAAADAG
ncbi:MAG: hypothetical protein LBG60_04735, partial [Bifidobacteriaceae bacterium]|nr:hypothetical protein [Bifidobacteriaceae bacterium]